MVEKNLFVMDYLTSIREHYEKNGIHITDVQFSKLVNRFKDYEKDYEELIKDMDELMEKFLKEYEKRIESIQLENNLKIGEVKKIEDLDIAYKGITINLQDIDLMMIANANNLDELETALSKITNIKYSLEGKTEEDFERVREEVYNLYLDKLVSKNDYLENLLNNQNLERIGKFQYLVDSGVLDNSDIGTLRKIMRDDTTTGDKVNKIKKELDNKEQIIYKTMKEYMPIEKDGIKNGSSIEGSQRLLEIIQKDYDSITIDEEFKYGNVALEDGSFYFENLRKALDFARDQDKKVRLNTLIFYMDCPERLYALEKTPENKTLVKEKLESYVDAITDFIVKNGYSDTVRSIDVFNELLNRFPIMGDNSYMYRGEIEQIVNAVGVVDDNIKSGWLKHLEIEDLCDVIAVARQNLPNTDFMYNDDHLIDPAKIDANKALIEQIRAYEEKHNVTLINSIGTQMHIDNSMTKEQMREMIINLSQFGLPIEITEFDIAMIHNTKNLSDEQIETLRQNKINEICECIEELKEKCDIRGFTIWSKTDKQNFRVTLENEIRIQQGLEPIETLHGGYYTDLMQSKNSAFNYHTHTNRCGHAGTASDREYVEMAKRVGITQLGFSDHVPVTELEFQDSEHSMHISEVDEYITSISNLQKENPNMKILAGFEVEYDPRKEAFFGELREKVDYMILGQHFIPQGINGVVPQINPSYPLIYSDMVCKAMESGIFDIVAHPDIFMEIRDNFTGEKLDEFMKNAKIASLAICNTAKELGIPLELNFGALNKEKKMQDGQFAYPYSGFWEIAAEKGTPVLYGVDAHDPEQFLNMGVAKGEIDKIIDPSKLNIVDKNYNPVEARKNNQILKELYQQGQAKAFSYETHLISQIMDSVQYDEYNPEEFYRSNDDEFEKFKVLAAAAVQKEVDNGSSMKKIQNYQYTKMKIDSVLDKAKTSVASAKDDYGCESKEDFISTVAQITEENTTKNDEKKAEISNHLNNKKQNHAAILERNKHNELVLKLELDNKPNDNKGYVNPFILCLIVAFICGVGIGIAYMIYTIGIV